MNIFQLWLAYRSYKEEQRIIEKNKAIRESLMNNRKFRKFSKRLKDKSKKS